MSEGGRRQLGLWWAATTIPIVIAALGVAAIASDVRYDATYSWPQFALGASCLVVGGLVARKRSDHPIGWLLLAACAAVWTTFAASPGLSWMFTHHPEWEQWARWILRFGISGWIVAQGILLAPVPLAFPDGFGRTGWRRFLLAGSALSLAAWAAAHSIVWTPEHFQGQPSTGFPHLMERLEPTFTKVALVFSVAAMTTMILATITADRPERRRQRGFAVAVALLLAPTAVDLFGNVVHVLPDHVHEQVTSVQLWALVIAPMVLGIGVLRHHLLDIQVILRRATLYATVAVAGAAIYLATVWVVATVRPGSDAVPAVIGAGVVAISLGLVRDRINRVLARRLFGSRDDPFAVVRALGEDLDAAPAQDHALQVVTDTLHDQLRLPYARAELVIDERAITVAESGVGTDAVERFGLSHQGVALGSLVVGRRVEQEPLTSGERDLIATLAGQAGVLAHNVVLVEALRRSRLVLVNAREEERRRIRADLHDGLGPTLATVAMGLEAGANRLEAAPELQALLRDLENELQGAIGDVRALVQDLRPAALDDLGLVSAVREYARTMAERSAATASPLDIVIDAPDGLGPLPAAVEVAAYRVALEALTNVTRHAAAHRCEVRLRSEDGLDLTVEDDGVGLGDGRIGGIGLRSMRERVAELDGRLSIHSDPGRGTRVNAWFPLIEAVRP